MKIKQVIANHLGLDESELKDEASFKDDLGTDSLTTVELIIELEEEFEIEIPDEDAETLFTVGDVVNYINNQG
ncbi:uncharacterized protein METZ01_LOCUS208539 [marine metagenome]|uniref:Carrier domain-containing protein n=1 Tax=marine metagenome TaxID=408172 RepID=A0A382EZ32_9ZZZZ|tara:strand:- start:174 stop:392 length:219 start_codon:yes stop_codon:yes gene_type:complete